MQNCSNADALLGNGCLGHVQIEKALAELENGNPPVALLVLKEMADNVPAVFNLHVRQFLTAVLPALSHQDKEIRLAAVQALRVSSCQQVSHAENNGFLCVNEMWSWPYDCLEPMVMLQHGTMQHIQT